MTDANKAPSYPWYPRDFAADEPVQLMTLAEEGAYRRLLDHQWLHGSVPGEIAQLAAICKNVPVRDMRRMWPKIEPCFEKLPGLPPRLRNRKLERVRLDREEFIAKAREAGKRGGEEASRRRREKVGEDSDPSSDPIATVPATVVAKEYPAVCSLQSASAESNTLPADAAPKVRPHDLNSIIGLVVKLLYFGNRPKPEVMRTEASIAKALGGHYGFDRLATAIEGLDVLRGRGELRGVGPRQTVGLRWINSAKFDNNQFVVAEDAAYRTVPSPRTGRGGSAALGDVIAGSIPRPA